MAEKELKQMAQDIAFIKQKVVAMEEEIGDISQDIHRVRPEYLKKLGEIERGKFYSYDSVDELRKDIEE